MAPNHWIAEEKRDDEQPAIATAKFIDMFRGERHTVFKPCIFDDGKFYQLGADLVKAFLYPAEVDALLWARWGGSGFDMYSCRQAVSQQYDNKLAKNFSHKDKITDSDWQKLIMPSIDKEADEEDWVAFRRRFHTIVITREGIIHRNATKEIVDVPIIHWPDGEEMDIFKPEVKIIMQKWKMDS